MIRTFSGGPRKWVASVARSYKSRSFKKSNNLTRNKNGMSLIANILETYTYHASRKNPTLQTWSWPMENKHFQKHLQKSVKTAHYYEPITFDAIWISSQHAFKILTIRYFLCDNFLTYIFQLLAVCCLMGIIRIAQQILIVVEFGPHGMQRFWNGMTFGDIFRMRTDYRGQPYG